MSKAEMAHYEAEMDELEARVVAQLDETLQAFISLGAMKSYCASLELPRYHATVKDVSEAAAEVRGGYQG